MNKKGFALIKLLAVIGILAIIALISIPIIMGVIEDAKKNIANNSFDIAETVAKSSAYGYINSVVDATDLTANVEGIILNGTYTISDSGAVIVNGTTNVSVSFKGDKPSAGSLVYSNGVLNGGSITINGKVFKVQSDGSLSLSK